MHMTTRAPMAVPSLVVGIVAFVLAFVGFVLFGMIAGVGAVMLGGLAMADIKSHSYQGHGFAVAGMILGGCALAVGFVSMVLLTS